MRRRRPPRNPWRFAAVSAGIVSFWLVFVGEAVVDYLAPVFGRAVEGVQSTVAGRAAPRALFQAKPTESISVSAPLAERAISLVAVLVLAALVFLGMRQLWRSRRFEPMSVLLCLAGLAYFVTLGLRLAPDAWEVGNRASAFLFIGLGFIVASSRLESWRPPFAPRGGRVLLTAGIAVAVMGGVVSGWPSELRLSQPLVVQTDGRRVESEPLAMARWFSDELPGRRIAATVGDARLALVHGRVLALAGARPDVQDILAYPWQAPWMWQLLRENRLRYVVADRRRRATDVERASFFAVRPPKGAPEILRAPGVIDKFEARGAERVLDSGHIVVFDMGERR